MTVFAPVERFEVSESEFDIGVLMGFAAPVSGPQPCGVKVSAGGELLATTSASRFSTDALTAGIRLGWCGFMIGGVEQCVALGHDVELRCMASDRLLKRWKAQTVASSLRPRQRRRLSVSDLRSRLNLERGCSDIQQVMPIAEHFARLHDSRAFVEISYRYLLDREADIGSSVYVNTDYSERSNIEILWRMIMDGTEFKTRFIAMLPGPFDTGFLFSLDALDLQQF